MTITKTTTSKLIGAALLLGFSFAAQAEEGNAGALTDTIKPSVAARANPDAKEMLKTLKSRYPGTWFTDVKKSGLQGIYEVYMGKNIAYTDREGKLFLFGHIFDMQNQRDVTAERLDAVNKVDFSKLPLNDAIKTVRGNGRRFVAVFSDPDCPYCRKLEQELARVNDITIYTFVMPLEQLHPESKGKAVSIWCSKDRGQAWNSLMTQDKVPESASCENPIDRNIALGVSLGINGTPTLITGDGRTRSGAMPFMEIIAWLDRTEKIGEVLK